MTPIEDLTHRVEALENQVRDLITDHKNDLDQRLGALASALDSRSREIEGSIHEITDDQSGLLAVLQHEMNFRIEELEKKVAKNETEIYHLHYKQD